MSELITVAALLNVHTVLDRLNIGIIRSNPIRGISFSVFELFCIQTELLTELKNLYSSPSIIRMMKSRRKRWAGHVAHMGEKRNALYDF
jgi:hypothetical protein